MTRGALKWILVVAGSAALGGALVLVTTRPRAPVPRATEAPPDVPVAKPRVETREPPPRDEPVAEPGEPPGAESIAGEIAALDKARRALAQGQALAALSELNEYDEGYADGTLKQEGILLRIEALAKAGELPTARKLAGSFLRDHPGSPHEKRVRTLVGEAR